MSYNMKCSECNKALIWNSDEDFEDHYLDGKGIVTNLSCNNCDVFVMVYKKFEVNK